MHKSSRFGRGRTEFNPDIAFMATGDRIFTQPKSQLSSVDAVEVSTRVTTNQKTVAVQKAGAKKAQNEHERQDLDLDNELLDDTSDDDSELWRKLFIFFIFYRQSLTLVYNFYWLFLEETVLAGLG